MDTVSTVMQQNSRDADSVEENSAYSANDEDYNDGNKKVFGGIGGEGPNNTYFLKYKNKQHSKNTRSKRKYYIEALKEEICTFSDIYNTREHDRREALNDLVIQVMYCKNSCRNEIVVYFPVNFRLHFASRRYPFSFISAHRRKRTQASGPQS